MIVDQAGQGFAERPVEGRRKLLLRLPDEREKIAHAQSEGMRALRLDLLPRSGGRGRRRRLAARGYDLHACLEAREVPLDGDSTLANGGLEGRRFEGQDLRGAERSEHHGVDLAATGPRRRQAVDGDPATL